MGDDMFELVGVGPDELYAAYCSFENPPAEIERDLVSTGHYTPVEIKSGFTAWFARQLWEAAQENSQLEGEK